MTSPVVEFRLVLPLTTTIPAPTGVAGAASADGTNKAVQSVAWPIRDRRMPVVAVRRAWSDTTSYYQEWLDLHYNLPVFARAIGDDVGGEGQPTSDLSLGGRGSRRIAEPVRLARGAPVPGTRYRIEEWIAEGGMGAVYRARHEDIGRVVALKILHGGDQHAAFVRLRQEARVTAKIQASNIVEVYDLLWLPDGRVAMAMELIEGQTLQGVLEANGVLPPGRTLGILRQVARGLAAAHAAGLVHLDIKPANIMLCTREGRPDFVKLLDFGIASALGEVGGGDVLGTAAYMAPERLGDDALDGRTDLYSVGCVAYQMLTGTVPFAGEIDEVLGHHEHTPAPSPRAAGHDVPEAFAALVVRCMAKDPSDRPCDATELEAALCEAQIDAGLLTAWDDLTLPNIDPDRRASLLERMPQPERMLQRSSRRGRWFALALGASVALGVVVGSLGGEPTEATSRLEQHIDGLTTRAYAAAAKTFYFYPPLDEPRADTAYTVLLELDALGADEPDATERVGTLRDELAEALISLGDRYWDEPGGRSFAIDYYAQALMFDPAHTRAGERAMLSVGQANELRRKAAQRAFSRADLVSVAPLIVLALEDEELRDSELQRLIRESESSPRVLEDLQRLQRQHGGARSILAKGAEPGGAPEVELQPAPAVTPELDDANEGPRRTPAKLEEARGLLARARSAVRGGRAREAEALFDRALAADPNNLGALMGLGDLHFDAGRYTESARHRRAAARISPRNTELRIGLGDALVKSFRYDDAMTHYHRAAELGEPAARDRIARLRKKMEGR